jgi:hypothetical protein
VALGIGANTALFSVIRAVLLRPLGYTDPQKLVVLTRGATPIHVDEFRAAARSYTETGVYSGGAEQLAFTGRGAPEVVSAARVSGNFLSILGVAPADRFCPRKTAPTDPTSRSSVRACGGSTSAATPPSSATPPPSRASPTPSSASCRRASPSPLPARIPMYGSRDPSSGR